MSNFEFKIKKIPHHSGVYLMKDKHNTIIYIGKAKNLYKRVTSYFSKIHQDIKTDLLVQKITDIDYILTQNEKEALILENQLIKQYLPHYNILLKDHKSYLRISIDYSYRFPRIQTTREKSRKRVRYFGPFPSSFNAKSLIHIGEKLFQLRRCSVKIPEHDRISPKTKPCFLYHLKICIGMCIGKDEETAYKKRLEQYIAFLSGHFFQVKKRLLEEMKIASDHMNYEEASKTRDLIKSLEEIQNQQKVYFESDKIIDFWSYTEDSNKYTFIYLRFNKGILQEEKAFHAKSELNLQDTFESVFNQVYISNTLKEQKRQEEITLLESQILNTKNYYQNILTPHHIVLPFKLEDKEDYEDFLQQALQAKIHIIDNNPNKWKKILEIARINSLTQWKQNYKVFHSEAALIDLKALLSLPKLPFRIETYDISNIQDYFAVGSCVVFVDGSPYKNDYRIFNIKYTQSQNDFAMIQETLLRRFKQNDTEKPDLIVIDGGKGQVSAAQEVLNDMKITIPLIGLAKKEELIILPHKSEPIKIPHHHPALRLLVATRNEAHRFANKQRTKRLHKQTFKSSWDHIKGINKEKKQMLIKEFLSPEEFIKTPLEDIKTITGLSLKQINHIMNKISSNA